MKYTLIRISYTRPNTIDESFFSDDYFLNELVAQELSKKKIEKDPNFVYLDRNVCIMKKTINVYCFKDTPLYEKLAV